MLLRAIERIYLVLRSFKGYRWKGLRFNVCIALNILNSKTHADKSAWKQIPIKIIEYQKMLTIPTICGLIKDFKHATVKREDC